LEREIRFTILGKRHSNDECIGKTINISSTGVLFTTDRILFPDDRLEISISWPAKLDGIHQLKLVAKGRVKRLERGRAAVAFERYVLRTQAISPLPRKG
jgi:hypothetical protein